MNFTDEEKQEYEEQLEALDEKTLLIQQVTELAAIRNQLELLNSQLAGSNTQTEETKTCTACNKQIPITDLKTHAYQEHNAPPDVDVEDLDLFE